MKRREVGCHRVECEYVEGKSNDSNNIHILFEIK